MVTLLSYVRFVLHLCMDYVENGRARKGRSMKLGWVADAGAVGRNSTSPPPSSAAAFSTTTTLVPNSTSSSAGIGTSAAPDTSGTSNFAGICTATTPGVMPPLVQPLATTTQDQLNLPGCHLYYCPLKCHPRDQWSLIKMNHMTWNGLCCFGNKCWQLLSAYFSYQFTYV
jgi:hypothetical protein